MALSYTVDRANGTVTVYLDGAVEFVRSMGLPDQSARGVVLDESDLTLLIAQLQGIDAYTPDPRTGEL